MTWPADRPSRRRSRAFWLYVVSLAGFLAVLQAVERAVGESAYLAAFWPVVLTIVLIAALVLTAQQRRQRRRLARDPALAQALGRRTCVVSLPPMEAFDAALHALEAIPGSHLDLAATSAAEGRLRATTRWNWLGGWGEHVDVVLCSVDAEHVAVSATSCQRYRGLFDLESINVRNLVRFFGALPIERPSTGAAPSNAA